MVEVLHPCSVCNVETIFATKSIDPKTGVHTMTCTKCKEARLHRVGPDGGICPNCEHEVLEEILNLRSEGLKLRAIARKLGLREDDVKRINDEYFARRKAMELAEMEARYDGGRCPCCGKQTPPLAMAIVTPS